MAAVRKLPEIVPGLRCAVPGRRPGIRGMGGSGPNEKRTGDQSPASASVSDGCRRSVFPAAGPRGFAALDGEGEDFVSERSVAEVEHFDSGRAVIATGFDDDLLIAVGELVAFDIGHGGADGGDRTAIAENAHASLFDG
jgi:hypothetical protein